MSYEQEIIWWGSSWIPPIMDIDPSTTATNVWSTTVTGTGVILNNGWALITTMWFVVYPSGNPSTIIWGSWVTDFPVTPVVQNGNIVANITWLTANTNYCMKPYAINSVWTSYWDEICFTTLDSYLWVSQYDGWKASIAKVDKSTLSILATYTDPWLAWNWATNVFNIWWGQIWVVSWPTAWWWFSKYNYSSNTWWTPYSPWGQPKESVLVWNILYNAATWDNAVYATNILTGASVWSYLTWPNDWPVSICTDGTYLYVWYWNVFWWWSVRKLTMSLTLVSSVGTSWRVRWIANYWWFIYASAATPTSSIYKIDANTMVTAVTLSSTWAFALNANALWVFVRESGPNSIIKYDLNLVPTWLSNSISLSLISKIKFIWSDMYALWWFWTTILRKIDPTTMTTILTSPSSFQWASDILFL